MTTNQKGSFALSEKWVTGHRATKRTPADLLLTHTADYCNIHDRKMHAKRNAILRRHHRRGRQGFARSRAAGRRHTSQTVSKNKWNFYYITID
ncbi:MAG: hypothetical protein R3D43_13495 [Tepidamorphaceae bacterium]